MPQLNTDAPLPSYLHSFVSIFSRHPDTPRKDVFRQLMLRSVRFHLKRSNSRAEDEEQLDGFRGGVLPLRIRPAFVVLNILALIVLAVLGFHPNSGSFVPINDKLLHFICFFFATGLFYFIWDVDEPARRVWIWRHVALILTWFVCFVGGGLGSEIVQSALPYKTFQWGDVFANFLGSALGLFVSYHAERRHRLRREIARLYEPLDQELYGDEEEEDDLNDWEDDGGDANDPWRNVRPTTRKPSTGNNSTSKAVRFNGAGNGDIESGRVTENESSSNGVQTTSAETSSKLPKEALFSIDDEDHDDDEAADAWKAAR